MHSKAATSKAATSRTFTLPALRLLARPLQPAFDEDQIGENALGVERLQLRGGIGGALKRRIVEVAQHQTEGLLVPHPLQRRGREPTPI